ncbi:MAG: oligosaccharide flippase family protein [Balneolaceae bacterium]
MSLFKRIFSFKKIHKDVVTLIGGTGVAQLIPIAISPILTRIYTPEDFGLLALFLSFTTIIGIAASGRYDFAILLPDTTQKAKNLAILAIVIAICVSILTFGVVFFLKAHIIRWLNISEISFLIYLLPIGIILISFSAVFMALLNRLKKYRAIAIAKINRSAGTAVGQLGTGLTSFTIYGLIVGKLLGDFFYTVYGYWKVKKNKKLKEAGFDYQILKSQAVEYKNFPKINVLHAVTNSSSTNMPNILLATLFSPAIAGFYNLSYRICYAPIQLIASSVQQVFSRSISERSNKDESIYIFTKNIFIQLLTFGIVPFLILTLTAPWLFGFIFGDEWIIAGTYTQVLSPFLFFVFITSPLTYIPLLLNKHKKAFLIDLVYLILRSAALLLGYFLGSALIAIILFSALGVIVQLYLIIWIFKLAKEAD